MVHVLHYLSPKNLLDLISNYTDQLVRAHNLIKLHSCSVACPIAPRNPFFPLSSKPTVSILIPDL